MESLPRSSPVRPAPPAPWSAAPVGVRLEVWISHVLRAGVVLAGAVIALGLLLLWARGAGPNDPISLAALRQQDGHALPVHPGALVRHALGGQPTAVIQLGVLLLILTPVARVAMTVWLFVEQRDPVFTAITLVVLAVLLLGLTHAGF